MSREESVSGRIINPLCQKVKYNEYQRIPEILLRAPLIECCIQKPDWKAVKRE